MSTHYSEFVLVFPAMELLIRRCQWYICKNQRMVSLDSVYDEALDAIHTIEPVVVNKWKVTENLEETRNGFSKQLLQWSTYCNAYHPGYSSQLGAPENDTIAVTKV